MGECVEGKEKIKKGVKEGGRGSKEENIKIRSRRRTKKKKKGRRPKETKMNIRKRAMAMD